MFLTGGELVEYHGLADLFEHVVGRDPTLAGMDRCKPDTHYIDGALAEAQTPEGTPTYEGVGLEEVVTAVRRTE